MKTEIFYQTEKHFSQGEKIVIKYIEKNPEEFCKLNLKEISKKTFYSVSGISKLSKKLNFKSFKQMQIWVKSEISTINRLEWNDNPQKPSEILGNIKIVYERALKRTLSDVDSKNIEKAIKIIKDKKQLMTFGIGSSKLAAIELSDSLNILGYSCSYQRSIHDIFLNLNNEVKESRAVILFSKTISTHELKILREVLKNGNVDFIIITANKNTEIHDNETHIHFRTFEQKERVVAQSSKISQILISDTIINILKEVTDNDIYENFKYEWKY